MKSTMSFDCRVHITVEQGMQTHYSISINDKQQISDFEESLKPEQLIMFVQLLSAFSAATAALVEKTFDAVKLKKAK